MINDVKTKFQNLIIQNLPKKMHLPPHCIPDPILSCILKYDIKCTQDEISSIKEEIDSAEAQHPINLDQKLVDYILLNNYGFTATNRSVRIIGVKKAILQRNAEYILISTGKINDFKNQFRNKVSQIVGEPVNNINDKTLVYIINDEIKILQEKINSTSGQK